MKEETADDQETEETRRYGELMHNIMEHVDTASDLPRALLRAKTAGQISLRQMELMSMQMAEALKSVESYGWFAPGLKVIKERGIVTNGTKRHPDRIVVRPDRIMIRPDETAVIVDYKFGEHRNDEKYSWQVKRYASELLKTGIAKKCEAYIWYVSLGDVKKVD